MGQPVTYNQPEQVVEGTLSTIGLTETEVLVITDQKFLRKSQVTAFHKAVLGSNTAIFLRYYVARKPDPSVAADWYLLPVKNASTGDMQDLPTKISGTILSIAEDLGLSACFGFRVTAQGNNAANDGTLTSSIVLRDN